MFFGSDCIFLHRSSVASGVFIAASLSLSLSRSRSLIQMARKEEGVHWEWPKEIPVIWKKGPMTEKDIATFPGWAELEDLD